MDVDIIGLDIHIESWEAATDQSKKNRLKQKIVCLVNHEFVESQNLLANDDEHKQSTVAIG